MTTGRVRRSSRRREGYGIRLTARGWWFVVAAGASAAGAFAAGVPELLYVAGLALVLVAVAFTLVVSRRVRLDVVREFAPAVAAIGQVVSVDVTVRNTSRTTLAASDAVDFRPFGAINRDRSLALPALGPDRRGSSAKPSVAHVRYRLEATSRGVFEIGPFAVTVIDPFALATRVVPAGPLDELVVTPALETLRDSGLAVIASEGASALVRRASGADDDLSTREYRTGDAMRRVHWRATAKYGELMVRQEEPRSHAEARVVIDTRASGYGPLAPVTPRSSPEFERALSIAGSIAIHLAHRGFAVEVVESSAAQLAPVAPLPEFLRSLATIELSGETGRVSPDSPLGAPVRLDRGSGSLFAVVSNPDQETLDRLERQRSGFGLAVACVVDPDAIADASSDDGARETATAALDRAGWTVVLVRPGDTAVDVWAAVADIHGVRHGR
ncbi:DUF58 domain-containing protein [Marisediminicola sp. LYQ134]|uniref:DUF58 domain-containing protein n=1 Tax=Marisediminicola sp. LYQ134 TaxID=3391061 RepID=UPI003983D4B2